MGIHKSFKDVPEDRMHLIGIATTRNVDKLRVSASSNNHWERLMASINPCMPIRLRSELRHDPNKLVREAAEIASYTAVKRPHTKERIK